MPFDLKRKGLTTVKGITRFINILFCFLGCSTNLYAENLSPLIETVEIALKTAPAGPNIKAGCESIQRPQSKDFFIAPEAVELAEKMFTNIQTIPVSQRQSLYYLLTRVYKCIDEDLFAKNEEFQTAFSAKVKMPIFNKNKTGVLFTILKVGQPITDLPIYSSYKGKLLRNIYPEMLDNANGNRLMENLNGDANHRVLTISTNDIRSLIHGEYQVPYHEMGHFLHLTAFGPSEVEKIHMLYENAKKNKSFLDDYAEENEFEYFAQGLEAYLSINKKKNLMSITSTREVIS